MIKELLAVTSLLTGVSSVSGNLDGVGLQALTWDYSTDLEDGAVYFIRSAMLDTKVIDVPNANYENGKDLIIYNSNGWGNQRFVLTKEATMNGKSTYSLSPVEDFDKVLSVEGNNSDNNKRLELRDQSDYVNNVNSYKFYFTPGLTANSYRIATGASDFSKYLTTENYSFSDSTNIVQKEYDSNYGKCFDWYFQKTDSLGVNVKNEEEIDGTETYHFNVRVPVTGSYVIETSKYAQDLDTVLHLYTSDGNLVTSNDDGGDNRFSRITQVLNAKQDYWVKLSGYNSNQTGKVYLTLKSLNTIYINTYYAPNDIDTRADSISPRKNLTDKGYYVKSIVNATPSDMLVIDGNGYSRFNNKYYMLSSHGSENGAALLGPNQAIYGSQLPNMSDVSLAVWAICYGGKAGNIAEYSAKYKGAKYSLGFPGLTYVSTSKTFTDKLWEEITNGTTIENAVESAVSHTKSAHWFTHMFGWGDDTIVSPQLYSSSTASKSYSARSKSISTNYLIMPTLSSGLDLGNENELELFRNQQSTKRFEFDDASIIVKFLDDIPTNDYFVIEKTTGTIRKHLAQNTIAKIQNIAEKKVTFTLGNNQHITDQYDFCLNIDGNQHFIRKLQYITKDNEFETLNEIYYDKDTNEIFSEDSILKAFTE